jgi:GT2 family glycosyltransferase
MIDILAVVVSYGGTAQLNHLVRDLTRIPECRVVLVENKAGARHDELPDSATVLGGHGNVGYGTAVNIAVAHARSAGLARDWLLVVNSDVALPAETRDTIAPLLARASGQAEVVGFAVRTSKGDRGRSAAVLPSVRTNAFTAVRGENAAVERWPHQRYPVGAFFAIRTETFVRLGGFDPAYWMYYEETDLFTRLRANGGRIAWAGESWPVIHEGGGTTGRAGLLHVELGRSAAIYARVHRRSLGASWPFVHGAQLAALAVRKMITGRTEDAARAARIARGLARGLADPSWEPAATSQWRATPAVDRALAGTLHSGHGIVRPRSGADDDKPVGVAPTP